MTNFDVKTFSSPAVWVIEILLGAAFIILANFAMKRVMAYFRKRSLSGGNDWREKADQIFYFPLHIMLWVVGVTYVIDILGSQFGFGNSLSYLKPLRNAFVIGCFGWVLLRWKSYAQNAFLERRQELHKSIDLGMITVIGKLVSVIICILTFLIALQVLGLDIMPLLAFGGIGAAAVGFAGKDVIANFFGGLMLHTTRPFTLGDQVLIPERSIEGTVEEIGWYLTSIRDKEKRPVYLPNSMFSTIYVVNLSRMSHRRILETIGVRSKDFSKLSSITDAIKNKISAHSSIDTNLPILVFFNAFKEYSLDIYIDAFTLATRYEEYLAVKEEILKAIQEVIDSYDAVIPNPTMLVELSGSVEK